MPASARLASLAILLSCSSALAAGVAPTDATPIQREEAQAHFGRGRDLFAAKKFDDAAAEFDKSYAIVASPNALLFLARCDRERGHLAEAYSELGRTAAEAREHASEDTRYAKTAQAATEERDALAAQLGFVTVNVHGGSSDATVTVAGARFPRAALGEPIPVTPGSIVVAVQSPGRADVSQTATVAAGERKAITVEAGPADTAQQAAPAAVTPAAQTEDHAAGGREGLRPWAYGAAGLGVAGLATFAVAGILSNGAYSDLQNGCHSSACPAGQGFDSKISQGKTEQTIANVGLVVGVVGASAAVTLFVLSLSGKSEHVSAVVKPTWAGVQGSF